MGPRCGSHWEPYLRCAGFIIILNLQLAICSTHTCLSRGYNRRSMGHASVKEILEGKKIAIFKFKTVSNIAKLKSKWPSV